MSEVRSKRGPSEFNFDGFDDGENNLGDEEVASSVRSDEDENMESLESVERDADLRRSLASSARGDGTPRNISSGPSPMYLNLEPREKKSLNLSEGLKEENPKKEAPETTHGWSNAYKLLST